MTWWIKPLVWTLWFVKAVRGSTSLEHGMVAGTAVVVATTMAAGLGSTNIDTAKQSETQVQQAVSISQTSLVTVGGVSLVGKDTTVSDSDTTVVRDNDTITLTAGQTARVVDSITFHVKNPGANNYDISNLLIIYQDATQRVDLFDPAGGSASLDATGKVVTANRVTFTYVTGDPLPPKDAGASNAEGNDQSPPTIGAGDLVEVKVDLTGLGNRLGTGTQFSLEMTPASGIAFTLERATPAELGDQNSLD